MYVFLSVTKSIRYDSNLVLDFSILVEEGHVLPKLGRGGRAVLTDLTGESPGLLVLHLEQVLAVVATTHQVVVVYVIVDFFLPDVSITIFFRRLYKPSHHFRLALVV